MPLPTKPPDAGNAAGCVVALLVSYFRTVRSFGPLLFTPREAFIINCYTQLLNATPADGVVGEMRVTLPQLRELVMQQLSSSDGTPLDTRTLLLYEYQMHCFARWQAVWACCWCVALPAVYLGWQLVKTAPTLRKADAGGMISALAAILLVTVLVALVCLLIWNKLRGPFANWCTRCYPLPGLLEFQEATHEEA